MNAISYQHISLCPDPFLKYSSRFVKPVYHFLFIFLTVKVTNEAKPFLLFLNDILVECKWLSFLEMFSCIRSGFFFSKLTSP